ncbi:MAG TPA: DUF4159 domain-containing protein [Bryobacterales bacterium]|jgi:hypothetical protein|nr:DUF4159 domain-containing protein [Bryobacterales bacterium]
MRLRNAFPLIAGGAALLTALYASQRPFRVYQSLEPYDNVPLPPDYQEETEWVFGRLMYPSHPHARFTWRYGDWREGGTSWAQDYPRADRHFADALRRLTRIHARSAEQPVNLDDGDDVYYWPWLCAGEVGDWKLTEAQAQKLREYLLRGGFLMLDDFWGTPEWERFEETMKAVFPDRPIVEIDDRDPIFHAVYNLDDRYQVPGQWALRRGTTYRNDGAVPHWRAIYDDRGRIMVAIAFNSDIGDSWEWADDPSYPERYSALGIRLGVNYVVYAMTH